MRLTIAAGIAYATALCITVPVELDRLSDTLASRRGLAWWFVDMNVDTTPFVILLVAAPFLWCIRCPVSAGLSNLGGRLASCLGPASRPAHEKGATSIWFPWLLAGAVGFVSLTISLSISSTMLPGSRPLEFGQLPPAYHDEYSYLFQAKTFLAGRVWFPPHPQAARLFDQVHVLNDGGKFASRYFPGTGVWMAPFLAIGKPYWGHWLAGALAAVFVFWTGRELGGNGVGLLAGLLTALSPGMGLFSNLLLAHHPGLIGLTVFTFAFFRMLRTWKWTDALLAGGGLSFAMLCRPLTAAGFGLPFGLWFLWWVCRGGQQQANRDLSFRATRVCALGAPLLAGFVILFLFNRAITGSGWTTPYQLYTETYTPRHVYGFNNRAWGEAHLGPKVLDNYDRWAENLTPALAFANVKKRLIASWQWTLGIVPLAMGTVAFFAVAGRWDRRAWLIPAAIVSLHLVHVPYWFSGIMHWHYVFETGPLWLLLLAVATAGLFRHWQRVRRPWMPLWWSAVIIAALLTSFTSPEPLWGLPRLQAGIQEVAFSRKKYAAFERFIEQQVEMRPALVLVDADPADRHINYVVNDPRLDAEVLFGHFRPGETDVSQVANAFPNRSIYLYRERGNQRHLFRLSRRNEDESATSGS